MRRARRGGAQTICPYNHNLVNKSAIFFLAARTRHFRKKSEGEPPFGDSCHFPYACSPFIELERMCRINRGTTIFWVRFQRGTRLLRVVTADQNALPLGTRLLQPRKTWIMPNSCSWSCELSGGRESHILKFNVYFICVLW